MVLVTLSALFPFNFTYAQDPAQARNAEFR